MMRSRSWFILWPMLALACAPVRGQDDEEKPKVRIEARSPDGRYALRYTPESGERPQRYDLIRRQPRQVLAKVMQGEVDAGPSARFNMKVLWRRDSRAFAATGMLWKRGSYVIVYVRNGTAFREVKLPELEAPIPDRITAGKEYPHIVELNSQTAERWQKNGSLVVKIENMQDGGGAGSVKATRTVVLSFARAGRARVVSSRTRFEKEAE
jgi:hypothetical protein